MRIIAPLLSMTNTNTATTSVRRLAIVLRLDSGEKRADVLEAGARPLATLSPETKQLPVARLFWREAARLKTEIGRQRRLQSFSCCYYGLWLC